MPIIETCNVEGHERSFNQLGMLGNTDKIVQDMSLRAWQKLWGFIEKENKGRKWIFSQFWVHMSNSADSPCPAVVWWIHISGLVSEVHHLKGQICSSKSWCFTLRETALVSWENYSQLWGGVLSSQSVLHMQESAFPGIQARSRFRIVTWDL